MKKTYAVFGLGRYGIAVARELVNRIQNLRKSKDFEVTDKIEVKIEEREDIAESLQEFSDYVCGQTLCGGIELVGKLESADEIEWADDEVLRISIKLLNL